MYLDSDNLAAFRKQITSARSRDAQAWEASRHLVNAAHWPMTLQALINAIESSTIPDTVKRSLVEALPPEHENTNRIASAESLKHLTGLPTSKALRALCLLFGVRSKPSPKWIRVGAVDQILHSYMRSDESDTSEVNRASAAELLRFSWWQAIADGGFVSRQQGLDLA